MPHSINILNFFQRIPKNGIAPLVKAIPDRRSPLMDIHRYIKYHLVKGVSMHKTTITIGVKRYGKLSYKDQYKDMVSSIKKHIPYHSEEKRYLYHFELTKNGILHAHGIEISTYQTVFSDDFNKYGLHNTKDQSFVEIKRKTIDEYLKYINKENICPWISNITLKDIRSLESSVTSSSLTCGGAAVNVSRIADGAKDCIALKDKDIEPTYLCDHALYEPFKARK